MIFPSVAGSIGTFDWMPIRWSEIYPFRLAGRRRGIGYESFQTGMSGGAGAKECALKLALLS
jgi:hypothetical protein